MILHSVLSHEFRTTFVESLLTTDDMREIGRLVRGCQRYVIQQFRAGKVLEAGLEREESSSRARLEEIAAVLVSDGCAVEVR